jgi:multiple sugar transport system ATP-binding protein
MSRLELRTVQKSYGAVEVIKGVDLHVEQGEFCVFVGPSGCGKSTLLRMIAGLEPITGGEIAIGGEVVNAIPAADRGLAMVFQSYALYPHMTVRQNLSFGLENINTPRPRSPPRWTRSRRCCRSTCCSTGGPRTSPAASASASPSAAPWCASRQVFLFDEPLSNLDAELRVDMRGEISALHKRLGNTMVYVTHDQVEAMTMADKIAVLRLGELEQFGRPLDLYNAPENLFVAGFIGSPKMNFLKGTVGEDRTHLTLDTGDHVSLPDTGFAQRPGQKVTLGLRPNDLHPDPGGALHADIRAIEQLGSESYLYGHFADGTPLTVHNPGQTPAARRPRDPHRQFRRDPPLRHGDHPQLADVIPFIFPKIRQGGEGDSVPRPSDKGSRRGRAEDGSPAGHGNPRAPAGGARRTVRPPPTGAPAPRFSQHLRPERRIDLEPVLPVERPPSTRPTGPRSG